MANRWANNGNSGWLYFGGLQNHCRWWLQPWNQKMLSPWKKSYDKPRQHNKNQRHYFVMSRCESWTIKKVEHWRTDAFELWCWRRLLRVPWTARRSNQSILKEISPEYSLEGLMLKLKLHLMRRGLFFALFFFNFIFSHIAIRYVRISFSEISHLLLTKDYKMAPFRISQFYDLKAILESMDQR